MNLHEALASARDGKEKSHKDGNGFSPMLEGSKDGEVRALIIPKAWSDFKEKVDSFSMCVTGLTALECDGIRFISDANVSRYSKEEFPDGWTEGMPMPSQDPKAVDVMVITQWEKGKPTGTVMQEYHILDDGVLEWKEVDDLGGDAIMESWMNDAVKVSYENAIIDPPPKGTTAHQVGRMLSRVGHTLMVTKELS